MVVAVHHSQNPNSDFCVLGVADILASKGTSTQHVVAFPVHKQQLMRFVRVQLKHCHGPRVHGVYRHEVRSCPQLRNVEPWSDAISS